MTKHIIKFCKDNQAMAVEIEWKDPNHDWHYFRIERVKGANIAFTGMNDNFGNKHDGDFFWCSASEIEHIKLRS